MGKEHGIEMSTFGESDEDLNEMGEKESFISWAKDRLISTIPMVRSVDIHDMKEHNLGFWIALTHLVLYLSMMLYFIVMGTLTETTRRFLSISPPGHESSVCTPIPVSVTGTYESDLSGTWITQK